jgi:hypothetical protein
MERHALRTLAAHAGQATKCFDEIGEKLAHESNITVGALDLGKILSNAIRVPLTVIPAQAGIQRHPCQAFAKSQGLVGDRDNQSYSPLDSGVRRNDGEEK